MPNSELEELQEILAHIRPYSIYNTYIEVSPLLYKYIKDKYETVIKKFSLQEIFPYPKTLYGYPIEINIYLEGIDYIIRRKEKEKRYE